MNEEPLTPLFSGFVEWHARKFTGMCGHQFCGNVDGCDVYLYRKPNHSEDGHRLSALLCWGNEWDARDAADWLGSPTWSFFNDHPRLKHVKDPGALRPAMALGLQLLSLHQ